MADKTIKRAWDWMAQTYQRRYNIPVGKIDYGPSMPSESQLKLLGSVRGKTVLDVGCGGGQNSLAFAMKGAKVTGVDISEGQIKFAKNLAEKKGMRVKFLVGSAENLRRVKSNSVDIVFSDYALQYVENLRKAFGEFGRVLRKNGLAVFSFEHPMYNTLNTKSLKVVTSYYKHGKETFYWPFKGRGRVRLYHFRRKIENIFDDLIRSGFVVERILEPKMWGYEKEWEDFYPKRVLKMVPCTIIFKCRKK